MTKFEQVAVVGMGAFGVALAKLASINAKTVTFWGRNEQICRGINETRRHNTRLPHVVLPTNVIATTDLTAALMQANCIIIAVPMAALSSVLLKAKTLIQNDAVLISTAKGIEESTLALPNDIIMKILPPPIVKRACYLSGPSFAVELAMDLPTALTLASADQDSAIYVQKSLSSKQCRLYRSDDVIGVNVGGALKNVIAIAAGASLGLGLGKNALAALITRGLAEMARLARCLNGKASTLSGLSGAGDLILSCTDDMSRNHRLGTLLVEGVLLDDALKTIGSVVEGAKTAKAIPALEKKHSVSLPISNAVYRVLYEGLAPKMAIATLLERELKEEHL